MVRQRVRARALSLAAALGLLLLLSAEGRAQGVGFPDVQAALRASDYTTALEMAGDIEDELLSAQARMHVLHHGGDLPGALRAGREALERFPEDLWLLDQTAFVAGTLGDRVELDSLIERMQALAASQRVATQEVEPVLARHRQVAESLGLRRAAKARSSRRSRWTVLALGGATLLGLGLLSGGKGRPRQRSTPRGA